MNYYGASELRQKKARKARSGKFPLSNTPRSFAVGEKVKLKNGKIATVAGKNDLGFYELDGFPGKCFSACDLKPAL